MDTKGLMLAYVAFGQLIRKCQALLQHKKKEFFGINFKIKDDFISLRKEGDESVQRFCLSLKMTGCKGRSYYASTPKGIHSQCMQENCTTIHMQL